MPNGVTVDRAEISTLIVLSDRPDEITIPASSIERAAQAAFETARDRHLHPWADLPADAREHWRKIVSVAIRTALSPRDS